MTPSFGGVMWSKLPVLMHLMAHTRMSEHNESTVHCILQPQCKTEAFVPDREENMRAY